MIACMVTSVLLHKKITIYNLIYRLQEYLASIRLDLLSTIRCLISYMIIVYLPSTRGQLYLQLS